MSAKDYRFRIFCFSAAKRAALRSKNKDWLDHNNDNVSECTVVSVSYSYTDPAKHVFVGISIFS